MPVLALCSAGTATFFLQIWAGLSKLDISLLADLEEDVCHLLLLLDDSFLLLLEADWVLQRKAFSVMCLLVGKSELLLTSMCTSVLYVIDYVFEKSIRHDAFFWIMTLRALW